MSRVLLAGLVAAVCARSGVSPRLPEALAAQDASRDLDVLRGAVVEQHLRSIEAEKRALTGPQRKVDHEIRRLLGRLAAPPSGLALREPSPDPDLRLSVRLRSVEPGDVRELARCGLELERLDRETMRAEGRARPADIDRLAELPFVA